MNNDKRIAKNTLMLYFRMLITLGVQLYTSRVVLEALGVVDFGLYSVVGGIVATFTFLNATLSGATSRFLTFDLGTSDIQRLKITFRSAITIHVGVAFIILILAETIGLWFVESKLMIPEDRMFAARVVYQVSILSSLFAVIRIPFNAAIIAHEKMKFYAYVSIFDAFLKLIAVFLLVISGFDKLILYGLLILAITAIITGAYQYYCFKKFVECEFRILVNKEVLKPMLSYSKWDLYGNLAVMARGHGVNVMLNTFYGPAINAAGGIAMQVQNAISGFADNFLTAIRPQIVKNYAANNITEMNRLMFNASKFSFLMLFVISFPLILENRFVLDLWLKNVPEYAVVFCKISLLNNLVSMMFRSVSFAIHATGNIKRISVLNGTIYLTVLPVSYVLLRYGYPPTVPYIINISLLFIGCTMYVTTLKKYLPEFSITNFFRQVVVISISIVTLASLVPIFVYKTMSEGIWRFVLVIISTGVPTLILTYGLGISKELRNKINTIILSKLNGKSC